MIIHSPFHDYYDAVAKSGVNREIRYLRDPITIKIGSPMWRHTFKRVHLFFCGKIYRLAGFRRDERPYDNVYFFTVEEVDDYVKGVCKAKEFEFYLGKRKRHPSAILFGRGGFINHYPTHKEIVKHFDMAQSVGCDDKVRELAKEHSSPIVVYTYDAGEAVVNPQLSKFNVERLIDPYTAFQEIMMYIGGMAKPEKLIPVVSNTDMIEAKGFDLRFSFRKDPQHG